MYVFYLYASWVSNTAAVEIDGKFVWKVHHFLYGVA